MSLPAQLINRPMSLYRPLRYALLLGDARDRLKELPSDSIDLIVTSPPYSDQRKNTYGGIRAENYVSWFMPIADELFRVLKPSGTFILNIKEKVVNGGKKHLCDRTYTGDETERLVMDRRIYLE